MSIYQTIRRYQHISGSNNTVTVNAKLSTNNTKYTNLKHRGIASGCGRRRSVSVNVDVSSNESRGGRGKDMGLKEFGGTTNRPYSVQVGNSNRIDDRPNRMVVAVTVRQRRFEPSLSTAECINDVAGRRCHLASTYRKNKKSQEEHYASLRTQCLCQF